VTLAATAFDAQSNVVPGQTVTWVAPSSSAISLSSSGFLRALARGFSDLRATIAGVTGPSSGGVSVYSTALLDSVSIVSEGWTETTLAVGAQKCSPLGTFDPFNVTNALRWMPEVTDSTVIQITRGTTLVQSHCFRALKSGLATVLGSFGGRTARKSIAVP
jgi:hypothetical protein